MNRTLALQQRRLQLAVRAALLQQWQPTWRILDPKRLDQTLPVWLSAAIPLVQESRRRSAGVAALHLRQARQAAGVDGAVPLQIAATAPTNQLLASLTATSIATIRRGFGNGQSVDQAMTSGFVSSAGAASRIALEGGRDTIVDTVRTDDRAIGWERITSGDPCAFCALLASRGGVYRGEDTADFEAHDHCSCSAEPIYSGSLAPTGKAAEWDQLYQDKAAGGSDQLLEFRRAYEGRTTDT